jgi:hypothetical protein
LGASVLSLGYCVVAEVECNWYLLDINVFLLLKKSVATVDELCREICFVGSTERNLSWKDGCELLMCLHVKKIYVLELKLVNLAEIMLCFHYNVTLVDENQSVYYLSLAELVTNLTMDPWYSKFKIRQSQPGTKDKCTLDT